MARSLLSTCISCVQISVSQGRQTNLQQVLHLSTLNNIVSVTQSCSVFRCIATVVQNTDAHSMFGSQCSACCPLGDSCLQVHRYHAYNRKDCPAHHAKVDMWVAGALPTKKCTKCGEIKPYSTDERYKKRPLSSQVGFNLNKGQGGVTPSNQCKACINRRDSESRKRKRQVKICLFFTGNTAAIRLLCMLATGHACCEWVAAGIAVVYEVAT